MEVVDDKTGNELDARTGGLHNLIPSRFPASTSSAQTSTSLKLSSDDSPTALKSWTSQKTRTLHATLIPAFGPRECPATSPPRKAHSAYDAGSKRSPGCPAARCGELADKRNRHASKWKSERAALGRHEIRRYSSYHYQGRLLVSELPLLLRCRCLYKSECPHWVDPTRIWLLGCSPVPASCGSCRHLILSILGHRC